MGWRVAMGVLSAALGAGCAGPGGAAGRAERVGRPFAEVRTVAVFRPPAREERHGKDVLDGLAETLAARGLVVRTTGPDPAVAGRLEELRDRLERWAGPALEARGAAWVGVHEGAGDVVRAAGVDAVAFGYRFVRSLELGQSASPFAAPRASTGRAALGALVLVAAHDDVLRVEWGADGFEAAGPASAAEAIEALAAVLAEPGEGLDHEAR
jgi:hypothetical protein